MSHPYDYDFDEEAYQRDRNGVDHPSAGFLDSAYEHCVVTCREREARDYSKAPPLQAVTVVVPNYNGAQFLEATLESVRQQTFANWECIVVDDFSTDASLGVVKKMHAKDRRFRLLPHRANGGANAARNSGVRSARTPYVCFLDADDLLMSTSLENRLAAIVSSGNERLGGSYSGSQTIGPDVMVPPPAKRADRMRIIDFVTASGMCPFNANQPMFRTSVLRDLGGFDESLTQAEDWEFWLRILRHGFYFVPTQWTDVTYRAHAGSSIRCEPVAHLRNGLDLYDTAHMPLPPSKVFSAAPYVYGKPWVDYKRQLDLAARVFEFCGMALAAARPVDEVVSTAVEALPDFLGALAPHRDIQRHLQAGLQRQLGHDRSAAASRYASQLVVEKFLRAFREHASVEVPEDHPSFPRDFGPTPADQRDIDVIFLPHKDYHVWTFSLLLPSLERAGIRYAFVDLSYVYRDERARAKIDELELPVTTYNSFLLGEYRPKMVVCMNDWDPINRRIIRASRALGIPTVGIVEGIQDYLDVDTGRERSPYRTVEYVVLPGRFDTRYFPDDPTRFRVGGVPRIDELSREEPRFPERPIVVINSNFTYNVLTDCRDAWVRTAVDACEELGYGYVISRHPADQGDFSGYNVGDRSMYELIRDGSVFVSRFSSGILESLAMGKPAVYYNPHGEKVDKFKDPQGAFPIATTKDELKAALRETVEEPDRFMRHADAYVDLHCGTSRRADVQATERVAAAVVDIFQSAQAPSDDVRARLKYLLIHRDQALLGPLSFERRWVRSPLRTLSQIVRSGMGPRPVPDEPTPARLRRKVRKLRRDPKAFFEDSRLPGLRALRHLF